MFRKRTETDLLLFCNNNNNTGVPFMGLSKRDFWVVSDHNHGSAMLSFAVFSLGPPANMENCRSEGGRVS